MPNCPTCGSALAEKARFCGTCGQVIEQAPQAPPPPPKPVMAKTMIGVPSPLGGPILPQPVQQPPPQQMQPPPPQQMPPPQPQQPPRPAQPLANQTMLGMPQIPLPPHLQQPPPQQQQQPPPPQAAPLHPSAASKTMLGVAAPGIAPIAPGQQQALHAVASKTMLGVAAPGIAPIRGLPGHHVPPPAAADLPPIVPAPAPLHYEALPAAPALAPKKGVPLVAALAIAGFVAIVGGIVIVLLVRGGSPLIASPHVGPEGQDQLHIKCDGCADGTIVHSGSSSATFKNKEADLDLPTPLKVGDNPLELSVEKSKGRADTVKLVVPVAFRVQPDLSQITAIPPALVVRVEAKPGSTVTIDGAPIALDASGSASQTIPLGDDARGPADEMKTFVKSIAYEVQHDGKTDKGTVKASIPITPLRIDAPASSATIDQGPLTVTGRAAKGASIVIDGKPVTPKPDGSFEAQIEIEADREIDVAAFVAKSGTAPPLGTRIAKIAVVKVKSLEVEGARQDKELGLGYDALAGSIASNLGQPFVVHGTVADARSANHRTLLIVDDQRGCAKGPCIVRIVYGGDTPVAAGDWVRAYGKLSGTVPWNGQNVPDVEATFLLKGKK